MQHQGARRLSKGASDQTQRHRSSGPESLETWDRETELFLIPPPLAQPLWAGRGSTELPVLGKGGVPVGGGRVGDPGTPSSLVHRASTPLAPTLVMLLIQVLESQHRFVEFPYL